MSTDAWADVLADAPVGSDSLPLPKIETGPVTHAEIKTAVQQMMNGKAGGVEG